MDVFSQKTPVSQKCGIGNQGNTDAKNTLKGKAIHEKYLRDYSTQ